MSGTFSEIYLCLNVIIITLLLYWLTTKKLLIWNTLALTMLPAEPTITTPYWNLLLRMVVWLWWLSEGLITFFQIRAFLIAAPIVLLVIVVGVTLTSLYGLCSASCSYGDIEKAGFNQGMSVLILTLQILSMMITLTNIIVIVKACARFKVPLKSVLGRVCGSILDGSSDMVSEQNEQDVYNLQKWRVGVEHELNFPAVRQYLQETRVPAQESEFGVDTQAKKTTSEPNPSEISSITSW